MIGRATRRLKIGMLREFSAIALMAALWISAWGPIPMAEAQSEATGLSSRAPEAAQGEPAKPPGASPPEAPEDWSYHFQSTGVGQGRGDMRSPYAGPNSFSGDRETATTLTATLFLGRRLWQGGALYADPEIAGGSGLSRTLGIAGFPNNEAVRAAGPAPKAYIGRLYLEQSVDLGEDSEPVMPDANQLGGRQARRRLTLTLGKLSALDAFDDNSFSHDGRAQFMNWGLVTNGAWDYPADARGYTYGGTAELFWDDWELRYGLFAEPETANGFVFDHAFSHAHGQTAELVHGHSSFALPGKIRVLGYLNDAHMGDYREALANAPASPDVTSTRRYRIKFGVGLNAEQKLTEDLGAFLRAGWNDGRTETFAYTEIDRTFQAGLALQGTAWSRGDDTLAAAVVTSGLSSAHRDYLAAGGLGFILGDGRLAYGPETVLEVYYRIRFAKSLFVTLDYQFVDNPGFNRDRGPVSIYGLRVHVEF